MTPDFARAILALVDDAQLYFEIVEFGSEFYLRGVLKSDPKHKTRKWRLSYNMTKSEVVQTALKCSLTSAEHEAREGFLWCKKAIFGPHLDVDALWRIADSLDVREEPTE
jgi:hypothetical protein